MLPDDGYQPPPRLLVDAERRLVRFTTEDGRTTKDFDFARLPVDPDLQAAFARAFDHLTGPSGTRKRLWTAAKSFEVLRRFAEHLAGLRRPPQAPAQLAPAHLDSYALTRRRLVGFAREFGLLVTTLRAVDGLNDQFAAKLAMPLPGRPLPVALHSYSLTEFRRILAAARQDVRAAATRIRAHRTLLDRWCAGEVDQDRDPAEWELGWILDHIDRVGDVPRYQRGAQLPLHRVARHGTVEQLMSLLHLSRDEAAAFLVLLIGLTGHNGGTIADAPATHHRADGEAGGTKTAIVELRKPRRGRRAHMDVPVADLPDWLGVDPAAIPDPSSVTGKDELHTPFGVWLLLHELTLAARRLAGSDRLLVCWVPKGHLVGRGFRVGFCDEMVSDWGRRKALPADHPQGRGQGEPSASGSGSGGFGVLHVTMPRLRLSFAQHHQKAVAHTDQVLATQYLGRDRGNLADYQRLVARVLAEQVATAKASVLLATLNADEVAQARHDPDAVAARFGVDAVTLKRVLAGELDTVLAACVDHRGGPHAPAGQPCRASFLRCLDCPCARAAPQHLPIQTVLLDALEARRTSLPPLEWAGRFAVPHTQLVDLLGRFPPATVDAARTAASDVDRRLVERLLDRELDWA
jgi:hypothetical protein